MAHILFVDDNPDLRETLAARLRAAGYQVTTAGSGMEGLELAETHTFDLILLDMLMPQLDGITTYQRLRDRSATREVPVILFTAMAVEGHWEELTEDGAGPCFVMGKPYETSLLVSRLSQVLGG